MQRRTFLSAAAGAALATPSFISSSWADMPLERDSAGRMLAQVMLNGRGPFRMIVDTGANRTALIPRVASDLGLATDPARTRAIMGVAGRSSSVPMVEIARLNVGAFERRDVSALVLSGYMLADADGIIGMDGMLGKRMLIDFERRVFDIGLGGGAAPAGFHVIPGRLRYGHLLEVPVEIDGVAARAIVDTGSEVTLANDELLRAFGPGVFTGGVMIVTGAGGDLGPQAVARLNDLRIGPLKVEAIAAHRADLPTARTPAAPTMHLGMDVLGGARAIAIDLSRAELQIQLGAQQANGLRVA